MKVNGASEEIGSDGPGIFALWFGEFYSIGGKAGLPVVYLHIKPEVAGAVQIFQRQYVSISVSISVPSEIKASLLRALQATRETQVNLLVTHSYLRPHGMLFIYYTIISIFTDPHGPVDSPEVSILCFFRLLHFHENSAFFAGWL